MIQLRTVCAIILFLDYASYCINDALISHNTRLYVYILFTIIVPCLQANPKLCIFTCNSVIGLKLLHIYFANDDTINSLIFT